MKFARMCPLYAAGRHSPESQFKDCVRASVRGRSLSCTFIAQRSFQYKRIFQNDRMRKNPPEDRAGSRYRSAADHLLRFQGADIALDLFTIVVVEAEEFHAQPLTLSFASVTDPRNGDDSMFVGKFESHDHPSAGPDRLFGGDEESSCTDIGHVLSYTRTVHYYCSSVHTRPVQKWGHARNAVSPTGQNSSYRSLPTSALQVTAGRAQPVF